MELRPAPDGRWILKRGMRGTDVAALQLNLPTQVDGVFGELTGKAVRGFQATAGLKRDGIAGPATQRALTVELAAPAQERYGLPDNLLTSLAMRESGGKLAAYSDHPSDAGYDLGAFQTSFVNPTDKYKPPTPSQAELIDAYDVLQASDRWGEEIKGAARDFQGAIDSIYRADMGGTAQTYRWMLAALNHNWPYAAQNIATIGRIFIEQGRDDRPELWVQKASNYRLNTPREWVCDYVEGVTALVIW